MTRVLRPISDTFSDLSRTERIAPCVAGEQHWGRASLSNMMSGNAQAVHHLELAENKKTSTILDGSKELVAELHGISRSFRSGEGQEFFALSDVALRLERGTQVALVGASGSGKSTLLNLLAGLDHPTSGTLRVAGLDLIGRSEDQLSRHRGEHIGVVFQFFQLLPTLTALENVVLPMELAKKFPRAERRERAFHLLSQFGVVDQAKKLPSTLSGGQQQRVAIARALANAPSLLVADEPTGNLDSQTAEHVLVLMGKLIDEGVTVVWATHERRFLPSFDRVITLADGCIIDDSRSSSSSAGAEGGL